MESLRILHIVLYTLLGIFLFFLFCFVIELIIMGCGINIQEKTVPSLYKNEITTDTIRDNFSVDENNLELKIKKGLENISNKKIVLCLLARDVENYIPKNIEKIMLLVKGFKDYRIVIFENDSEDQTRERIKEWTYVDNKVTLLNCCDEEQCDCKLSIIQERHTGPISNKRIVNMSKFRNKLLDYVLKQHKDYDYMMVVDIDIKGGIYRDGFITSFADDNWDAIFAKGIKPFPFMFGKLNMIYDTLAFLDKDSPTKMKDNLLKCFDQLQKVYNKKVGSDMVPVESAFNGAGIYRIKKIIDSNARYNFKHDCEHIDFHKSLYSNKLYANPSFIITYGINNDKQIPFKFVFNTLKSIHSK